MAVALFLTGPAKRHRMQDRHIIPNPRGRAKHDRMRVIKENALTHRTGGMDVHTELFGHTHLKEIGQIMPPLIPQPMPDPIGLNRLEAFEIQQGLQILDTGGIAFKHSHQIRTRRIGKAGIGRMRLITNLAQHLVRHLCRGQF